MVSGRVATDRHLMALEYFVPCPPAVRAAPPPIFTVPSEHILILAKALKVAREAGRSCDGRRFEEKRAACCTEEYHRCQK
eukprot:5958695-Prymnesium_polylepis.1